MQLSFDPRHQLHQVTIKLTDRRLRDGFDVELLATSTEGTYLSGAGLMVSGTPECELLPSLLAEVATGWLYHGALEAIELPVRAFKSRRRDLLNRDRWGFTPQATEGS
jgi:hypothetical protein